MFMTAVYTAGIFSLQKSLNPVKSELRTLMMVMKLQAATYLLAA